MKQFLTGNDLFSLVLLLRSGTSQTLLLVEGGSDSQTLDPHIDPDTRIVPGYGRVSVEQAIELSDQRKVVDVVGLVDADLDRHRTDGTFLNSPNIHYTENYDLEADIFFAPGFATRLIYSQATREDIESRTSTSPDKAPTSTVTRLATIIGDLRLESIEKGYGLNLRTLPLGTFLMRDSAAFDTTLLAAAIHGKSTDPKRTKAQILNDLNKLSINGRARPEICCGHDIMNILSGALTKWWGAKVSYETVCRVLRGALSGADLEKLKIHADLQNWATANKKTIWL